jgi:hypothetical protein
MSRLIPAGAWLIADAVRENLGAGAGCRIPSTVTNVLRVSL